MSNLGMSSKVQKKHQGKDAVNNMDPVHVRLVSNKYGSLLALSDDFFYYCLLNGITHETINDKTLIDRRNDIINKLDENADLNDVSYTNSTMFFNYERLCDEENFDLTSEENSLLWRINCLLKQIGELYNTTKVFLDVHEGIKNKETGWKEDEDDRLGFYTILSTKHSGPQVWLLMDNITEEAKRLCCDRKYIIAKVYIHEMMHRFFDLRPDLGWKPYVKEIEEPMAEFATLKFIEKFCKENRSYARLLPVAQILTDSLYQSNKWFIYSLGGEMYYNNIESNLIDKYRKVSMLLHKTEWDEKQQIELGYYKFSPMADIDTYVEKVADCKKNGKNLKDLMILIKDTIERYSNFFL